MSIQQVNSKFNRDSKSSDSASVEANSVLMIEDDIVLGQHLRDRLTQEGYQVNWLQSCAEARKFKDRWHDWDIIILDVGLPDGLGFDLAAEFRAVTAIPIIFMTALSDSENRLRGYELGAEEFIPKPFHLKELLLRLKHVLDKHRFDRCLVVNQVTIDWRSMVIRDAIGNEERLTFKDYRVLKLLVDSFPRPVTRDEILDKIWGEDQFPSPRTVDNSIVRLRQVLKDEKGEIIGSVRGLGYQWRIPIKSI